MPIDQSDVRYEYGPDSNRQHGNAAGETVAVEFPPSPTFPGTSRNVWVHVPPGYDPAAPASVVLFQDGWSYLDPDGEIRAGVVLDNLVSAGELPYTIGVFVDPGVFEEVEDPETRKNRNAEYDAFTDRYVTFLLDEVVPLVQSGWHVSTSANDWAICGGSSGGNCAFTAAWMRPDRISKVIGFNSSFAQIPGGNPYPTIVRAAPPKPLRILLHAAHRDINWNQREWNWFSNNLQVAAALAESGYDFRLVLGDGGHSLNHGGVLLPDSLRWLFRSVP
jgi:enterochelin esterase-like enzyme